MDYNDPENVPSVWRIGDVILDRYEVKQVFTGGGMGLVYRVHHGDWNVELAVKSPRPEFFQSPQQIENFEREAETWVNLRLHPHIVSCYYVRRLGGIPRIFAEFVDGGSLADWIRSRRLYEGGSEKSLERILDIAIQFARALHYAHEQGLIHQDVKPGNVLVNTDGTVKVTDFGLAKARALASETATRSGDQTVLVTSGGMTPAYCSPEQANGKPLSRRTDIWSWAISVLEMFVGEPPCHYGGQLAAEVFASYLEEGSDDEILPLMRPSIARLLTNCFQRDPAQRPELGSLAEGILAIYEDTFEKTYPRAEPKAVELLAGQINNRAISLRDLGANVESDHMLEEALRTYPRHLDLVFNHGILEWRSGESTDVALLTELKTIREAQTSDWLPAYAEGLAHLERWDIESAITLLGTAVRLGGDRDVVEALERASAMLPESARCLGKCEGHARGVSSVILAPDERTFLSGSYDQTVRLWDVATQRCIRTFEGHAGAVTSISISGDGKWGISSGQDKTLRMWDIQTARCVRVFEAPMSHPAACSLSPDSRRAVSAGGPDDFLVRVWDTSTGLVLSALLGHEGAVLAVCFSSDGGWVLSGGWDNTMRLWNTATSRCEQIFQGHTIAVTSVAFSRDSRFVLSGAMDSTMRLWDAKTGRCLRVFAHPDCVYSVSLNETGRFALSGCLDGTVRLWDLTTSRCLRTFGLDNPKLPCLASASLGGACRYAISGHMDNTVRVWNVTALCRKHQKRGIAALLLSRPHSVEETGRVQNEFTALSNEAHAALIRGDHERCLNLVEGARGLQGFELAKVALDIRARAGLRCSRGKMRRAWCAQTFKGHEGQVSAVCLTSDGTQALSGSIDATIRVWDVATGRCVKVLQGHNRSVTCIVCDRTDGHWALSGSYDCTLRLWNVENGVCIREFVGHQGYVYSVCVSRDGRWIVSGSDDKTARVWELSTGRCVRVFTGHTGGIRAVTLSPDGQWLATGSYDTKIIWDDETKRGGRLPGAKEKMLRLWHFPTGKCVWILEGHTSGVQSVAFSEDGRRLVSWSDDGTVRVWGVETGRCVETIRAGKEGVLSTDGRWIVSHGKGHSLHLWDLMSQKCECVLEGHTDTVISSFISADSRWVLSGSMDHTVRLWEIDWDFASRKSADWDEGARFLLANFLSLQTPYACELPQDREPKEAEIVLALTRSGKPSWTENDFKRLLHTLACAGYGWLRPEGVQQELNAMAADWHDPAATELRPVSP